MINLLWERCDEGKNGNLTNWEVACLPKKKRGLVVSNIVAKNEPLLAKWLWMFPMECASLLYSITKIKYRVQATGWDARVNLNVPLFEPCKRIWDAYVPLRVKVFVWYVAYKKINTNGMIHNGNSLKLPELHPELILEILLRLPVKSLLRFRSACKSWCTMISRPQFVKKHLSLITKDDTINPWRIMIRYLFHKPKSCSLDSVFDGAYGYAVNLNYPLKTLRLDAGIEGSCDGLVCVYFVKNYDDIIYIWNPTTGKHKILPSFGKGFILGISYGFGYDSSNDDYKVVRISNFNDSLEVKIYSLRTDSWRKIRDFTSNIIRFHSMDSGKLVNGSPNWVGINPSDHSWVVTSLDLAEETY
ncbi:hypothetical protein ACSBR1_031794 [Camellia fascicularis]